jgi:hypothetical protein
MVGSCANAADATPTTITTIIVFFIALNPFLEAGPKGPALSSRVLASPLSGKTSCALGKFLGYAGRVHGEKIAGDFSSAVQTE